MKRLDYIDLFTKKVIGSISESENASFNELLEDANSKNDIESLQKIWDASGNYSSEQSFNSASAFQKFSANNQIGSAVSASTKPGLTLPKWFLISLILAIIALLLSILFLNEPTDSFSNESEKVKTVNFADNIDIWLNTNASIHRLEESPSKTQVEISGFVFLDNSSTSKVIELHHNSGTFMLSNSKASVFTDELGNIEISMEEGKLTAALLNEQSSTLFAGETLKIDKFGKTSIGKVNSNNAFTWKIKTLQFNNTPLDIVIHDLERYFDIVIESDISDLANCYFTSPILTNTKLSTVFSILNTSHKAEFVKHPDKADYYQLKDIDCL